MGWNVLDDPICNEESDASEDEVDGSQTNKQKCGKVPKKIVKAERERVKREQLNELFSELASVLELNQENNGKASVLNETIRLLKDMISHIQILKKENVTLLSESQYMTAEKNELKDETTSLEVQIKKMQNGLEERVAQSKPDLNKCRPSECWQSEMPSYFMEAHHPQTATTNPSLQPPIFSPLYVIPTPDFQAFTKTDGPTNPPITVSKPHAQYPTPADSWPLQLLSQQADTTIRQTTS